MHREGEVFKSVTRLLYLFFSLLIIHPRNTFYVPSRILPARVFRSAYRRTLLEKSGLFYSEHNDTGLFCSRARTPI